MMSELSELKPGDLVIVDLGRGGREVRQIARTTKTQIIIEYTNGIGEKYEKKFDSKRGREIGGGAYYAYYIRSASQEEIAEVKAENRRNKMLFRLHRADYDKLSTSQIERIMAILDEEKAESEAA